jgi:hypothetical protein
MEIRGIDGRGDQFEQGLKLMMDAHGDKRVVLEVGGDGAVHTQTVQSIRVERGDLIISGEE